MGQSQQAKTWAEFSTLGVGVHVNAIQYTRNNKTPQLTVENSAQTTLRSFPTSFDAPN